MDSRFSDDFSSYIWILKKLWTNCWVHWGLRTRKKLFYGPVAWFSSKAYSLYPFFLLAYPPFFHFLTAITSGPPFFAHSVTVPIPAMQSLPTLPPFNIHHRATFTYHVAGIFPSVLPLYRYLLQILLLQMLLGCFPFVKVSGCVKNH